MVLGIDEEYDTRYLGEVVFPKTASWGESVPRTVKNQPIQEPGTRTYLADVRLNRM